MKFITISLPLAILLFMAATGWGQQEPGSSAPIQIEADRMETSQEKNIVVFSGHVRASQDELVINANEMTVRYVAAPETAVEGTADVPGEGLSRQIESITARGSVEIVQGNWIATGETMDFKSDKRIVILAGDAKAWQDQNMVSGEKIILYLDEGRSVVERSNVEGERVKAFIYPGSQDKKDSAVPPTREQ